MRLDEVTVVLRPRGTWESMDLGCAMVRRDAGTLLALWCTTVVPIWAILAVLFWRSPAWFGIVVWWLKPLYDRVPLHFLSRAAFGERPGLREMWRAWPRLWLRNLGPALLWRRLSLTRSFSLPVTQLEGVGGKHARQRIRALAVDGGTPGTTATWTFIKLEVAATLGLVFFTSGFLPDSVEPDWQAFFAAPDALALSPFVDWWLNFCYLAAITLVEPFYTAAGFGLYLNCRTKLEGWDVELTFRKLADRLRSGIGAAAAVVLLLLTIAQTPAHARENIRPSSPSSPADDPRDPNAAADAILDDPAFEVHSVSRLRWVPDVSERDRSGDATIIKSLVEVVFWLVVAAAVVALAVVVVRNRHLLRLPVAAPRRAAKLAPAQTVMGMDIRGESVPDDPVAAARDCLARHGARAAVGLLYRSALSRLVTQLRVPIRDSDTEDDCLDRVPRADAPAVAGYFSDLTALRVRSAYAGVQPSGDEFEHICQNWPFANPSSKPKTAGSFLLLVLPALLLLPACNGHMEEYEDAVGYKGVARTDPFLAARQLLEEFGNAAERAPTLGDLPPADIGVIVMGRESKMPVARANQLMLWVLRGGHLVYPLDGIAPYNDWNSSGSFWLDPILDDLNDDPILNALDITVRRNTIDFAAEEPDGESNLAWNGREFAVEMPHDIALVYEFVLLDDEWALPLGKDSSVLSLGHGLGRVTVLTHARPIRNRYLGDADHAAWLVALAESDGGGGSVVHFQMAKPESFATMLWRNAWMAIVGIAMVAAIWLWKSLPRFGPAMPVNLSESRRFADHVASIGRFFFRMKRTDVLVSAAADSVRDRARRRYPQLSGDALHRQLAAVGGVPAARVEAALAPVSPGTHPRSVRHLQDLQSLRNAL